MTSLIGTSIVQNNAIDTATGKNNMGLENSIFKALYKNVGTVIATATGGLPGAIIGGFFSAVVGGSSSSTTVNENINTTITLTGTSTESGSFPSSPTSMYVPGSVISQTAQNFVPLYNNALGVFNLNGPPKIYCHYDGLESATTTYTLPANELNGSNLIFNPAVLAIAKIQNIKEEVVLIDPQKTYLWRVEPDSQTLYGFYGATGTKEIIGTHTVYTGTTFEALSQGYDYYDSENGGLYYEQPGIEINSGLGIRVQFDVVPNNGAPKSTIIKTFTAPYSQSIVEQ